MNPPNVRPPRPEDEIPRALGPASGSLHDPAADCGELQIESEIEPRGESGAYGVVRRQEGGRGPAAERRFVAHVPLPKRGVGGVHLARQPFDDRFRRPPLRLSQNRRLQLVDIDDVQVAVSDIHLERDRRQLSRDHVVRGIGWAGCPLGAQRSLGDGNQRCENKDAHRSPIVRVCCAA